MEAILVKLAIYLGAAVIAVPLSQRLGFGSVLGYLLAGMAIGPALGLVGNETAHVQEYAEYGVVLMLFLIGLELHPKTLWDLRGRLVGLGGLQVAGTLALVAAITRWIGLPWNQAIAVGLILSLSSTAIVMQTLAERKLLTTEGGRASLAVLLFQDVAAIPFLAIIPLLAIGAPVAEAHHGAGMLTEVSPWVRALIVVAACGLTIGAGRYLSVPVYRFLTMARLPEIQLAGALLLIVLVSLVMALLGLSPALGSFLIGVTLASSPFRHQLEADIGPFKGILMGLFFITVGAGIDLARLADEPLHILGLTLALLVLKMAVLWPLARLFGLPRRARILFTLGLAQAGEFSFFLLSFAASSRVLPAEDAQRLLLVIALSMVLTPALFRLDSLLTRLLPDGPRRGPDAIAASGPVIVAGMGRFGQVVNRMLTGLGHRTVVLDSSLATVERMRALGIEAYYGDVARPDLLVAAGIAEAKAIVLAIDDRDKAVALAQFVSTTYPQVQIIARARDRHQVYALYAAGARESVREVFDSAVRAGGYALRALGYDARQVADVADEFVRQDRRMLEELATLWRPDLPVEDNPAYLAKAREQAAVIEAALRGRAAAPAEPDGETSPDAPPAP